MAKRQRTLQAALFRAGREVDSDESFSLQSSKSKASNSKNEKTKLEIARENWKDNWYTMFDWIDFNYEEGRVFCKVCKKHGGRNVFAKAGSINVKVSAFQDHGKSEEHKNYVWVDQKGKKTMEKMVAASNKACDEAVLSLFKAAYFLGRETISYCKFPALCEMLVSVNANIPTKLYHDEKACAEMLFCISKVLQKKILDRVRNSKFFGIMIDESTDVSVTGHIVVFACFVEEGLPVSVFLGLIHIEDGKKDSKEIFNALLGALKEWDLNLDNLVGFGSDGASTMVGKNTGVSARLKKEVNPFLTAVHCVAHRTNLAALQAANTKPCDIISSKVDDLMNSLAAHFKKSSKRKVCLQKLQDDLFDSKKVLKRFIKIRWLSRWQAVTSLCDSLESVLTYLRDTPRKKKNENEFTDLYEKLRDFKMLYCLHFLADILHCLAMLSKLFQAKFVDITSVGSIIKTEITQIKMLFLDEHTDLNAVTFNEDTNFHVLPEFGPFGGYMRRFATQIRGCRFLSIDMIRDPQGRDLEEALLFQKQFSEAVIHALECRFEDNDIVSTFKVLNPTNMPSRQVGLAQWGCAEMEVLCGQYGVERNVRGKILPPLIKPQKVREEFFAFKIQSTTEWCDKTFKDLWGMITWNPTLQLKYENLLMLAEIARVQCISTATCERAFSIQNIIKNKFRNKLGTKNLDSLLRIALEGPTENADVVLIEAVALWKNSTKFRYLFSNPELYLSGQNVTEELQYFDEA